MTRDLTVRTREHSLVWQNARWVHHKLLGTMENSFEAQETIEMELDDSQEQILIQCSNPPNSKPRLLKLSLPQKHVGGAIAVLLLIIGTSVLFAAVMEHRKQRNTVVSASEKQSDSFESSLTDMPVSAFPSFSQSPSEGRDEMSNITANQTSQLPTASRMPSIAPSEATPMLPPSSPPTSFPTAPPTGLSTTYKPIGKPTIFPISKDPIAGTTTQIATFYVIGDVPYNSSQAEQLRVQMNEIPNDAEFVVHVGDLRFAGSDLPCRRNEYSNVASIMRLSPAHAPVFMLLGDNDYNDCTNPEEGLSFWEDEFIGFESRYWNHTFDILNQPDHQENFGFKHKGTLFIGLNLVGGAVLNLDDWNNRLTSEVNWTIDLIRNYVISTSPAVGRVVIFGHAYPTSKHNSFFNPLRDFIRDELQNSIPFLYINGDRHRWLYEPSYLGQPSFLRIMVNGLAIDPPLKVIVTSDGRNVTTQTAFKYYRQL